MPVTAANAAKIIVAFTFSGTALGIVKSINGQSPVEWLKVRGQGKMGPSSLGMLRRDSVISIEFFGAGPVAVDGTTKASVVLTMYQQDSTTITTWTWTNMKAGSFTMHMDDDAPPATLTQEFHNESDMSTDNFTVS